MNRLLRTSWLSAAASALLLLTGCGGGGGGSGSPGTLGTASLAGHVVLVNGSTNNLGGVKLTFPRTGQTVTTASDGSFQFGTVPAGTLTVRLGSGTGLMTLRDTGSGGDGMGGSGDGGTTGGTTGGSSSGSSGDASGDDVNDDDGSAASLSDPNGDGDNNDTGDDDLDVTSVASGETVDLSLSVDHGIITSLDVARSGHEDCQSEVRLQRSVDSDDPDVTGKVRTENRTNRQRIKIAAEHLTAARSVRAVIIAPDLSEADLGAVDADASGEARWDVNTMNGDTLPFGVASVADLVGYGIEVRDAGSALVLLFGTMPDSPLRTSDHGSRSRGRALLTPGTGAVGEAHVAIESRTGTETHEEFKVDVEHEVAGLALDVYVEDPTALGTFALVGSIAVDGEHEAELEIKTQDGDTLPFGLTSVSGLVGMQVELRNAVGGAVLYSGLVPALVAHD